MNFHRRQILPAKSSNDGVSPLAIFRKNIGKDLSQIAMPVSMNEPLSMLEKACEDLEYSELLDQAAGCSDSIDRLKYVAVFVISSYASSQWRSGRKVYIYINDSTPPSSFTPYIIAIQSNHVGNVRMHPSG
jgi:hypothetical protein